MTLNIDLKILRFYVFMKKREFDDIFSPPADGCAVVPTLSYELPPLCIPILQKDGDDDYDSNSGRGS